MSSCCYRQLFKTTLLKITLVTVVVTVAAAVIAVTLTETLSTKRFNAGSVGNKLCAELPYVEVPQKISTNNVTLEPGNSMIQEVSGRLKETLSKNKTQTDIMTNLTNKTLVLVINYPGQQGSGALCLSALQCFLSSIYDQFYIIEPYLHDSHLTSITSSLRFSSLFDFNFFNSQSRKFGYTEMLSLDQFMHEESVLHHKYIIYIHVESHHKNSIQKVVWTAHTTSNNNGCFDLESNADYVKMSAERYRRAVKEAKKSVSNIMSKRCLVRVVELEMTRGVEFSMANSTVSSVFNFIFDKWNPQDVILIFTMWPKSFIPVEKPLNGIHCYQEYMKTGTFFKSQFQVSQNLIKDAERYEKMFLGGRNSLAIMFRVERVVTGYLREKGNSDKTIEGCFQEVLNLTSNIENASTEALSPLVTLDIGGKYGTDSFSKNKRLEDLSRKTLESLYHNKKWSMSEWETSFVKAAGGVTQLGYIAALQRLLASRADCLILMGGGDYQAFALADYLEFHKTGRVCVHVVCSISEENNEVQNIIKGRGLVHVI